MLDSRKIYFRWTPGVDFIDIRSLAQDEKLFLVNSDCKRYIDLAKSALIWQISAHKLGEFLRSERMLQNVGEIERQIFHQKLYAGEFSLGEKMFGDIDSRINNQIKFRSQ